MMSNPPLLKKKIHAFLSGEEGKISKENVIKLGVLAGIIAMASQQTIGQGDPCGDIDVPPTADGHSSTPEVSTYTHNNDIRIVKDGTAVYGEHTHAPATHTHIPGHGQYPAHNDWEGGPCPE